MGLIHIYCGDGKGKTTAAFGLALRAAGSGMKVHIVQLMKGNETSELNSLEKLDGITLSRCDKNYGFTFRMTEQERNEITLCHNRLLNEAYDLMQSGSIDMLIIDEDTIDIDVEAKLEKLKSLYEKGLIREEEYKSSVNEILSNI